MDPNELRRLHAAWQKAAEAYRPGAVDDCARADELAEAVNALFDPMAAALPALIKCAEALAVAKEFAEFWIEQSRPAKTQSAVEAPGDYSERWRLWLAIGHQSKSMEKIDAALAALKEAGK